MPNPILARADALMQRRRSSSSEIDDVPILTDAVDDEPALPLLLDIEIADPAAEPSTASASAPLSTPAIAESTAPTLDAVQRDALIHELARRVTQRLAAELPRLVDATVRDFLAEQQMIATLRPDD